MKWIKAVEYLLVTVATAAMVLLMLMTQDGNVLGPVSGSFLMIFSVFLSVDLSKMIKETSVKPPGDFEKMHFIRYGYSILIFFGLLVLSFVIQKTTGNATGATQGVFGSGAMTMIALTIGALGGNKIATGGN